MTIWQVKCHEEPELVKQLNNSMLKESHSFSVQASPYVFFFYLGKFQDGWGGLIAVGIWT